MFGQGKKCTTVTVLRKRLCIVIYAGVLITRIHLITNITKLNLF